MMDEGVREIVYETHRHASGPYVPNYPPKHQVNPTGSLFSRTISRVKQRWGGKKHQGKQSKPVSLYVSERGENVAVVAGNYITLLHKDDNFQDPCGTFTTNELNVVTSGAWSEGHNIFGFMDDADNIYFIKTNGEEITRVSKSDLKITFPVIGLLSHATVDASISCMCCFEVVTADGRLHCLEVSQDSSALVPTAQTSNSRLNLTMQFPRNVFCHDFHPELSMLAVIGSADVMRSNTTGCCTLSVWRKSETSDMELAFTCNIEGVYSSLEGSFGQPTYPKVLFSSSGKFVVSLDVAGSLYLYDLDNRGNSISASTNDGVNAVEGRRISSDVADFTWWSDRVLAIAERNGQISMVDILNIGGFVCKAGLYCLPVIERVHSLEGQIFILESNVCQEKLDISSRRDAIGSLNMGISVKDGNDQSQAPKMCWSLVSFSEKSITEMYNLLICKQDYQGAFDFADRHGLDKDDILKAQWSHSELKIIDVTMYLNKIQDQSFVLSECLDKVGATEDAERALLTLGIQITDQYGFYETREEDSDQLWDFRIKRIHLLQYKDKLETYLGINMGRFSSLEYKNFRSMLTHQAAITLAEAGKIGALNLLFKRHPYSLSLSMLEVLSSIPETVSVESYSQLLPGRSPPSFISLRGKDWVECKMMVSFIKTRPENNEVTLRFCTEQILHDLLGFVWPSVADLLEWYKIRAREIDALSGQLDNCMNLIEFGCSKGLHELQFFKEDISYLHQLIYCDHLGGKAVNLNISEWEQLSDYQKFKLMLDGVVEDDLVERLNRLATPFMHSRCETWASDSQSENGRHYINPDAPESFLVKWLKEISACNGLEICSMVIEEGCRDIQSKGFFRDETEVVDCTLQCIYRCTALDSWNKMAAIFSKLPQLQRGSSDTESLLKRLKEAEGHVEAGRLLAYYQVPKPLSFFLDANLDEKNVKQLFRLILSKFSRRQPGRADDDWATMWRDMQTLRDKAFRFLDLEYMLIEFCKGLLKAGKFALVRNYLKGTSIVSLPFEKAENIVVQAAREYLFSASSLACSEIWKAKECLNLLPNSSSVRAEADIIDALTLRLPKLGLTILPVQFKQVKDPMEIVKLAITSQSGAYMHVDELIEIAKLLGLRSEEEISAIEEAIAREAAVSGDLQLAYDLCLILVKKGHGPIWDLCAAIARGPALDHMDMNSRKQLLGFALSHCDEESIGELLNGWKDLDIQDQCDVLKLSAATSPADYSHVSPPVQFNDQSELTERHANNVATSKSVLCSIAERVPYEYNNSWESFLEENGKLVSFAAVQVPWLLELSANEQWGKSSDLGMHHGGHFMSAKTQALVLIFSWLARNNLAPKDSLIESLARSIFERPVSHEDDILGCSVLLNLVDAFNGVQIIEEQLKERQDYKDISSMMKVGMTYSLQHSNGVECKDPVKRRELAMRLFKEKHTQFTSEEIDRITTVDSKFWREWKLKLEEQKHMADHSRLLEQVLPGVDISRCLSGDVSYIEDAVFSLIESIKLEKKHILKKLLLIARTYSLNYSKVLQCFLLSALLSDAWTNEDITAEISDFKKELVASAETVETLSLHVYPSIDGCNKQRVAYVYGLLSECFLSKGPQDIVQTVFLDSNVSAVQLGHFYKVMEQECQRLAFIEKLNIKNIAGLRGLNLNCLQNEIYSHVNDNNLESLAKFAEKLGGLYNGTLPECIPTYQDIYKYHILNMLVTLENQALTEMDFGDHDKFIGFIGYLEQAYDLSKPHLIILSCSGALEIMKRYLAVIAPLQESLNKVLETSVWQECLVVLLNFWIRLTDDMLELISQHHLEQAFCWSSQGMAVSLKVFISLVLEDMVSPIEGWGTIVRYANYGLQNDFLFNIQLFCKAMIFSGCGFGAVSEVYTRVISALASMNGNDDDSMQGISLLYSSILETVLQDLNPGSAHQQELFHILSSLCNLEGDLEDLQMVRLAVWEKLTQFSDNYKISGDVRVFVLEILQSISGSSVKGFSGKLQIQLPPWEGWNERKTVEETADDKGTHTHLKTSDRFASNLVALRSTQMAASISPGIEISAEDLLTAETAISCFVKLSEASTTKSHFDALIMIMEEWEGVFTTPQTEPTVEASDPENNWDTNGWDEGWDLEEEASLEVGKKENSLAMHPLQACWMEILKKLAAISCYKEIFKLIDTFSAKTYMIIDENNAHSLISLLVEVDYYAAVKVALLLPYEALHVSCLDTLEVKLKQGPVSDTLANDQELLILILASGVTSTIITKSQYGNTFSFLCYLIGNFSRQYQESHLILGNSRKAETINPSASESDDFLSLFNTVLFPCFISELVKANQQVLAGFLVTKSMHTTPALSLINIADSCLRSYLERKLKDLEDGNTGTGKNRVSEILGNTLSRLKDRSQVVIKTALVSTNVR